MAGSVRLSDIQNSNLDFERKQHLANWLIKSSPHMPNPVATTALPPHHPVKSPIYFWGQPGHMSLTSSKSPIFTSQTNLPLQIITTQEGHKPKLRRFNSHDTSANMFSVADFENARLASKQKQQQPNPPVIKSNSLGDGSTEDSENSKFGSDSSRDAMPIERFLHRNFLPKVARLITRESCNENSVDIFTLKSSQQNLPKLQSLQDLTHLDSILNAPQPQKTGDLMLIYKQIRNRKLYHAISTKSMDWKKGIKIPQEYPGYFSLVNEKGGATASIYTTIIQLVRERVYKFLSMENMVAYSESQNQDIAIKSHYVKTTAKAGQVFRLLAVFEDGRSQHQNKSGPLSDFSSSSDREKVRGRYAQLLCENRQMLYVSLATKGKFYEVEMTSQSNRTKQQQQLKNGTVNPDYVHKINDITQNSPLPLNVRLISGNLTGLSTDCITIHKVSMEDILISCPIDERDNRSALVLKTISILPDMKLQKCLLGYDTEKKLLSSPNIQNILKYCKFNYDNHIQAVEADQTGEIPAGRMRKLKGEGGFRLLRPINLTKLLHREKSYVAHEKEDSIIFLTKAELQRLETQNQPPPVAKPAERNISSKMKVFEPSKRKWFAERKNSKNKTSSFSSFDVSLEGKQSIDRYSDMSKLIQERFGSECDITSSQFGRESRALSDIGYNIRCSVPRIDKTMSLENMKLHSSATMLATTVISPTPDLVKVDKSNIVGSVDRLPQHQEQSPTKVQQSFISKKLYSEFHVKTKQNSKSSSNLNQLWHQLGLPQKSSKNSRSNKISPDRDTAKGNFKLADEYSNVQDSIVTLDDNASSIYGSRVCMAENIYAEICVHNTAPDNLGEHSHIDNTNL
ncbi:LOC108017129 [Sergentomyia squamirostris]